jgi:hypothetical protein
MFFCNIVIKTNQISRTETIRLLQFLSTLNPTNFLIIASVTTNTHNLRTVL